VFVIGGADVYRQLIPLADVLVLTEVWADVEGDAHFPPIDSMEFIEERREPHEADSDNEHDFDFVEYRRRR
jgi:dihydrofolate reductase